MQSKATTVEQYLAELPPDRRDAISAVRKMILKNLDKDYEEAINYGMIGYYVPHRIFPDGYHCDPKQPLGFLGLASQKHYMSLYMMCGYTEGGPDSWFRKEWAKTGKKLDMGKCCIRFRKLDDLAMDVVAEVIRKTPAKAYIEYYKAARELATTAAERRAEEKKTAGKPAKKKAAAKTKKRS